MRFCERPYRFVYMEGYAAPGTVVMCPWMSYGMAREIGNLLEEDLYEIWHSKKAESIRQTIEDQSFRYCEKMSCPYLENDSLPEIDEKTFREMAVPKKLPDMFNLAHDLTCNHKCPSCRYEVYRPAPGSIGILEKVNEALMPYLEQASYIAACGLGDLFSSPQMMDLMASLRMKNKNARITLETNGVYCDEAHLCRLSNLQDCHLTIGVTPNSYDRATYQYLSGGYDDLERVENHLHLLGKLRRENKLAGFYIAMVIQEKNYREVPSFVDRSLNTYGADQVILRTIYKWNKMTADDYWFKDVMNPLHPYHKDMIKVLEDPTLKDARVYNWTAFNIHPAKAHPAYRYKDEEELLAKMAVAETGKRTLADRLRERGAQEAILYGDTCLTPVVLTWLKKSHFPVRYILARDVLHDKIAGMALVRIDAYHPKQEDVIIAVNFLDISYIKRDLSVKGFCGALIGLDELYPEIESGTDTKTPGRVE